MRDRTTAPSRKKRMAADRPHPSASRAAQTPVDVVAEASDGWKIRGKAHGAGPLMLLFNGMVCTTQYWPFWIRRFQPLFRVTTWDYRGHNGDEVPPLESIRVAGFASDAGALLEKLSGRSERAILVAHSMGVQVALELYRQAPERVAGLVLLCGTYGHPLSAVSDSALLRSGVARLGRYLRDHPLPALERFLKTEVRKPWAVQTAYLTKAAARGKSPEGMIHELLRHVVAMDWRVVYGILADYVEHTAAEILPEVKVPTLVIGGGSDGWTPPGKSREMAETIPHAELMLLDGCSHLALVEEPDKVHARVESFLRAHGLWPRNRNE